MVSREDRRTKAAIELPPSVTPFGSYCRRFKQEISYFLSGMLPTEGHEPKFLGRIGKDLNIAGAKINPNSLGNIGINMLADVVTSEVQGERTLNYQIAPLLVDRWSPRSMTGESLTDQEFFPLFEAARWAPSSYNCQLWRFVIARRQNREEFDKFLGLLTAGNRPWANNAAALVVCASRTLFEYNDKPSVTHAFDAGAAWENLALEAARRGLVAHGMEGFDYARAKTELLIPDDFDVLAMIAIGRRAPAENLPEKYRAVERPSSRRPLKEIVFEGVFGRTIPGLP